MEGFPAHLALFFALACFLGAYALKSLRKYVERRYGVPAGWAHEREEFKTQSKHLAFVLFVVSPLLGIGLVVFFFLWDRLLGLLFAS